MKTKNFLLAIFIGMFLINLISSATIQTSAPSLESYVIDYPKLDSIKADSDFIFHIHVMYNNGSALNVVNNDVNLTCSLHGITSNGTKIFDQNLTDVGNNFEYDITVNASYLKVGTGYYFVYCEDVNGIVGFVSAIFEITPNGMTITSTSGVYFGIILAVILILCMTCLYFFKENEDLRIKLSNFGLFFIGLMFILFILWKIAEYYLISLEVVSTILMILFGLSAFGFFVLFVFMMFKVGQEIYDNKEVQRLMKRGMTEEEAFERIRRKRKR